MKCLSSVLAFFNRSVWRTCTFKCTSILISVCVFVYVCLSSSWLACLLMFGHMLSFISLRHQSCWPAVGTAALCATPALFLSFTLALVLSLCIFLTVCLFLLVCLLLLLFLSFTVYHIAYPFLTLSLSFGLSALLFLN